MSGAGGRLLGEYPDYVLFNRESEMDKPIDPKFQEIGEEINNWLLNWAETNPDEAMVFFSETGVHLLDAAADRSTPDARISDVAESFRYSGCPAGCDTCIGVDVNDSTNYAVHCRSCVPNATLSGNG